jgi:hypothetical protein
VDFGGSVFPRLDRGVVAGKGSVKLVVPTSREIQDSNVTQLLKLLADFVPDMTVARMERSQGISVGVYVGQREGSFAERPDNIEDVESPAALFDRELLQGLENGISVANDSGGDGLPVEHIVYPRLHWNSSNQKIAADPPLSICCFFEWWAFFDDCSRKCKAWYQKEISDCPVCCRIFERQEIWSSVALDSLNHFEIVRVVYSRGESFLLALQLECGGARGACEINRSLVCGALR